MALKKFDLRTLEGELVGRYSAGRLTEIFRGKAVFRNGTVVIEKEEADACLARYREKARAARRPAKKEAAPPEPSRAPTPRERLCTLGASGHEINYLLPALKGEAVFNEGTGPKEAADVLLGILGKAYPDNRIPGAKKIGPNDIVDVALNAERHSERGNEEAVLLAYRIVLGAYRKIKQQERQAEAAKYAQLKALPMKRPAHQKIVVQDRHELKVGKVRTTHITPMKERLKAAGATDDEAKEILALTDKAFFGPRKATLTEYLDGCEGAGLLDAVEGVERFRLIDAVTEHFEPISDENAENFLPTLINCVRNRPSPYRKQPQAVVTDQGERRQRELVKWAERDSAALIEWADEVAAMRPTSETTALICYVAKLLASRRCDIISFPDALYRDVVGAELKSYTVAGPDKRSYRSWKEAIREFPYPASVVRIYGRPGIFGVAVVDSASAGEFVRKSGFSYSGASHPYAITLIPDNGLSLKSFTRKTEIVAEKLLIFLDCKDIATERIFIRPSGGGNGLTPPAATSHVNPGVSADIRRGADLPIGPQPVRVASGGRARQLAASRAAHFVRGHYHNYWCGPIGCQHLETRWLKPYFASGSYNSVAVHKVRIIKL